MSPPPELKCPLASATGPLGPTIHENFSFLDTRKTRQSQSCASNVPINRTALSIIADTPHMILKSETYHFHRLDLTRQSGFIVTIYGGRAKAGYHSAACNSPRSFQRSAKGRGSISKPPRRSALPCRRRCSLGLTR